MNAARRSDYDRRCGENERLAAKLRHLHAALAELRSEAVVLRSENAQLRSEGAQLRTESETLRAHRAQLRSDIAQLRTETAAMRERVGQLEFALNDRASTAVAGQVTGTSVESNVVLGSGQSGIRVTGRVWLTNLAGVRVCAQARFFWQDTDQYVPARGGGDLLASATERVIDYTSVNLTFVLDFPYAAFPSIAPGTHALQGHIFIWREHEGTWPLLATALTSGFRVYAQ
jgi:regulator of replication initiation timing